MDLMNRIPPAWAAMLRDVQRVRPHAIIAGGALRDLAFGGTIKDIDVFVPMAESQSALLYTFTLPLCGWRPRQSITAAGYAVGMRDEVRAVDEYSVPGIDVPVQIIHMELPVDEFAIRCLTRMDFDACRVAFDGQDVLATGEFIEALENRRFTLLFCEDAQQARRSLRRADRFAARYPDVTFDVSAADPVLAAEQMDLLRMSDASEMLALARAADATRLAVVQAAWDTVRGPGRPSARVFKVPSPIGDLEVSVSIELYQPGGAGRLLEGPK